MKQNNNNNDDISVANCNSLTRDEPALSPKRTSSTALFLGRCTSVTSVISDSTARRWRRENFCKAVRFFGFPVFHCGRPSIPEGGEFHRRSSNVSAAIKALVLKQVLRRVGGRGWKGNKGTISGWVCPCVHTGVGAGCPTCAVLTADLIVWPFVCEGAIRTQCVLSYAFRPASPTFANDHWKCRFSAQPEKQRRVASRVALGDGDKKPRNSG